MPRSINLTSKRILNVLVNVPGQFVEASYVLMDENNREWERKSLVFWMTIPDLGVDPMTGEPLPVPDNWKQLPAKYIPGLADLYNDLSNFIDQFEQLV